VLQLRHSLPTRLLAFHDLGMERLLFLTINQTFPEVNGKLFRPRLQTKFRLSSSRHCRCTITSAAAGSSDIIPRGHCKQDQWRLAQTRFNKLRCFLVAEPASRWPRVTSCPFLIAVNWCDGTTSPLEINSASKTDECQKDPR